MALEFEEQYKMAYRDYYRFSLIISKLYKNLPKEMMEVIMFQYDVLSNAIKSFRSDANQDVSHLELEIKEIEDNYFSYLEGLLEQDRDSIMELLRETVKKNLILYANPDISISEVAALNISIESLYNTYIISNIEKMVPSADFNRIQYEALDDVLKYLNAQLAAVCLKRMRLNSPVEDAYLKNEYEIYKRLYDIYSKQGKTFENETNEKSM